MLTMQASSDGHCHWDGRHAQEAAAWFAAGLLLKEIPISNMNKLASWWLGRAAALRISVFHQHPQVTLQSCHDALHVF